MHLRTKIEVLIIIGVLVGLSFGSGVGVNRTITPSGDDTTTRIINSNGNYWSLTAANIQTAINNLDDTTDEMGVVTLPGNSTVTVSTQIDVTRYTILDLNGCELRCTSGINILNMSRNSMVRNGVIRCTAASTANCIMIDGQHTTPTIANPIYVQNIQFIHGDYNGTAINLTCDGNGESIVGVTVDNCMINRFRYGIHINCPGGVGGDTSYINGNQFSNIKGRATEYFIYLNDSGVNSGANSNTFINVVFQATSSSQCAFYCEGSQNWFFGRIIDWSAATGTYSVNLSSNSQDNYLNWNVVTGTYVNDGGGGNEIDDPTHTIYNYQYVPTDTSNPYGTATKGQMWLNETTGELCIYDGSIWRYYDHK